MHGISPTEPTHLRYGRGKDRLRLILLERRRGLQMEGGLPKRDLGPEHRILRLPRLCPVHHPPPISLSRNKPNSSSEQPTRDNQTRKEVCRRLHRRIPTPAFPSRNDYEHPLRPPPSD